MPTSRIAFTFEDPGATLNGSTSYSIPQSLPDPESNGYIEIVIAPGSTLGRISRSSMNTIVGDGGYFIRSFQLNCDVETTLTVALRPPQGITYAGNIVNLEVIAGAFGSNNSWPNAPEVLSLPKYVPPGWEICIRAASLQFSSDNTTDLFIGSFAFEFDTARTFEEACDAMEACDLPNSIQVGNWV